MKQTIMIVAALFCLAIPSRAFNPGDINYSARLGYNIGGTMPVGFPAEIRDINSYTPQAAGQLGLSVQYPLSKRWGLATGFNLDRKAMKTDADVKLYHMAMVQGSQSVEGYFTGRVLTKCSTWSISIPLQATFNPLESLSLRFGPYISFLTGAKFDGYAYDGYLRHNTPTGEKIIIGNDKGTRGDYDFSDDMRRLQWGLDLGIDWKMCRKWGIYGDLSWGMAGAFKSSFHTISQKMHPIYFTLGVLREF